MVKCETPMSRALPASTADARGQQSAISLETKRKGKRSHRDFFKQEWWVLGHGGRCRPTNRTLRCSSTSCRFCGSLRFATIVAGNAPHGEERILL